MNLTSQELAVLIDAAGDAIAKGLCRIVDANDITRALDSLERIANSLERIETAQAIGIACNEPKLPLEARRQLQRAIADTIAGGISLDASLRLCGTCEGRGGTHKQTCAACEGSGIDAKATP